MSSIGPVTFEMQLKWQGAVPTDETAAGLRIGAPGLRTIRDRGP